MFRIVAGAVRFRAAQALTLLILTALPATVAAAAPWYVLIADARSSTQATGAVPAGDRMITVHQAGSGPGDDQFGAEVAKVLPLPGATPILGLALRTTIDIPGGGADQVAVVARDGFCDQVRLAGRCPSQAGEAALTAESSRRLRVRLNDRITVRANPEADPVPLTVTGTYEPRDPSAGYWADELFRAESGLDPIFTVPETAAGGALGSPTLAWAAEVPLPLLRGDDGFDLGEVVASAGAFTVSDPTGPLRAALAGERDRLVRGVLLAVVPALLLAWFAIGLAGRYTARDRRRDAALLKLRGITRLRLHLLLAGQELPALLGGAVLGLLAGPLSAILLAGPPFKDAFLGTHVSTTALLSTASAAAVVLIALATLLVADLVMARTPVSALLRRVVPARRTWMAGLIDVVLVTIAVAAAYQARSASPDAGVGALAPAAVAVAVAVLLARLLARAADAGGGAALRSGRLGFGLTLVRMSRQPGADRLFALTAAAVALLAVALGAAGASREARLERAESELGADRVLTVRAATWTALTHAVAAADPDGRYAAAAVVDRTSNPPLLAVDASRAAAAAAWRPVYGPRPVPQPATTPSLLVNGRALTVRVDNGRAIAASLDAVLRNEVTGAAVRAGFGRIPRGEHTVSAEVPGCADGCRLVRWELPTLPGPDGNPDRGPVTLHTLTQSGPDRELLGQAEFADSTRWRTSMGGSGLELAGGADGLTLAAGPGEGGGTSRDQVFTADTALPVAVALAGPAPATWRFEESRLEPAGIGAIPVRVTATPAVLPVLGTTGVLLDLTALRQLAGDAATSGVTQVWLAPGTPESVVDALRTAGLTVLADDSVTARATRLPARGATAAGAFALFAAVMAVLVAAAVNAVAAAVDREPRRAMLRALRTQGLSSRTAATTRRTGVGAVAISGAGGGLLAAVLAREAAGAPDSLFADGWRLLAVPEVLGFLPLLTAGLTALLVLTATNWLAGRGTREVAA
ncbi:hypothetical protein FB565_008413 [Actinoplanes lutulentus]|uniref:ABC3 transporter permease C-terminal domain-containing protein n=1 Tax=Actinoplanes lutulentus TaxID=1287878 RepID=A0A327Z284_9ACTN|nr:FtsX-like permease family protein [Actinoplanes lutulentus]MBB2948630.1 hypothetical protein [Actinoplanes lutulentus]RAK27999.1 hypothetical protein B0I29_12195 [Actinoplanes lutulentus]